MTGVVFSNLFHFSTFKFKNLKIEEESELNDMETRWAYKYMEDQTIDEEKKPKKTKNNCWNWTKSRRDTSTNKQKIAKKNKRKNDEIRKLLNHEQEQYKSSI
jgi:hypothetical protein